MFLKVSTFIPQEEIQGDAITVLKSAGGISWEYVFVECYECQSTDLAWSLLLKCNKCTESAGCVGGYKPVSQQVMHRWILGGR